MENPNHIESGIIYRDKEYTLFWKGGSPCLIAGSRRFLLSCHPYEPCLHIAEEDGPMTLIHNAFNPYDLLDVFREGRCVTSITGRRYSAHEFCRLVEFAAGKGEMGIDDAEKVFGEKPIKEKAGGEEVPRSQWPQAENVPAGSPPIIKADPALELLRRYPDLVPEYCLVKNESANALLSCRHRNRSGDPATEYRGAAGPVPRYWSAPERHGMALGPEAHRWALEQACRHLMAGDEETDAWQFDTALARPNKLSLSELFASEDAPGSTPGETMGETLENTPGDTNGGSTGATIRTTVRETAESTLETTTGTTVRDTSGTTLKTTSGDPAGATAGAVPGKLSYRRAFLHPPYGSMYTAEDFERINAALFPAGTERLEVFEWSTDWSDYFDDGHEWWGALCLTIYDPALDRFVVILASSTD